MLGGETTRGGKNGASRGGVGSRAHLTRRAAHLGGDVPHPGDDDLEDRPDLTANEMHLVNDEQRDVLHALALLPPARDHVPALRRADDDGVAVEQLEVGGSLAGEHLDGGAELRKRLSPRGEPLLRERLQRRDEDAATVWLVLQHA
eukprot:867909-Pleurochrysis_carterae.AAC.1